MSPAWRGAPVVLRLHGVLTLLLLLRLCPHAARGDCRLPPDVPNAQPALNGLTSFPEKITVTYKCNEGFVKVPGKTDSVVCLKGNEWSGITEFCNRSCDVPTRLLFASLKKLYIHQNYFPVGSIVEYECRNGYKKDHSLSGNLTCLQNFTWSKSDEFCKRKSCPDPGEIRNGHVNITTDILFGASIIFSCDPGYKLVGETISYCVLAGKNVDWSDPLPECKESSPISKVTPTPPKPTLVDVPGTKAPSTLQKPTTVTIPVTGAPSPPLKPTTVNVPATGSPSLKRTTVNVPATGSPSLKPTTVNVPATGAPSPPLKPTTVNVPATGAPSPPLKPTTVNISATGAPSPPLKPTTVNVPATGAPSPPLRPTTVNVSAIGAPSSPLNFTTINSSVTEAPLSPQTPTLHVPAMDAPSTLQKPITARDPATITKIFLATNYLSRQTPPAAQTPIMANSSVIHTTPKPQRFTTKTSFTQSLPVTQKFTEGLHTTQRLTSAHVTETRQTDPKTTTVFHERGTSTRRRPLTAGVCIIVSGLVAGTIIFGTLILVKIYWDYGKSGSYYTHENNKTPNVMFHNLTVTGDASEV